MNQHTPGSTQSKNRASGQVTSGSAGEAAVGTWQEAGSHFVREPAADVFEMLRDYAREKPDVAAMWCFAAGVLVGWKLHP